MMKAKDKLYRFDIRRRLVADARQIGVKPTARKWQCSRNTVRHWLRRYLQEGLEGLKERSHAPTHCPHKTPAHQERQLLELRRRSGYGPRRLKMEFDLGPGHNAIARIVRAAGLSRPRKTKRQKKNDLRAVKARLAAFERVEMDIKYLNDIAFYLPQMRQKGLPGYQYTLRDVRTGLMFLAYGTQLSKSLTCIAARRFLSHLERHGVRLPDVTVQTDNGTEFDGQMTTLAEQGFRWVVEDLMKAHHAFIPPG